MKKRKSLKFNFIMNTFLQGSAYILPFLITPYVSRVLLPIGMGKVSFATSVLSYFTMFAMLGVPIYGIRTCAKASDNQEQLSCTVQEILIINSIMALLVYVIFFVSLHISDTLKENTNILKWMSISIALNVINIEWFYKGIEAYAAIAIRSIVVKTATIILVLLYVRKQSDYIIYGILTVFASYGAGIWNIIAARKYIKWKKLRKYHFRRHLKPIIIFFAMSVAVTIYTHLDIVMLGVMSDDVQIGIYDAAVKEKSLLLGVVSSFGAVILPRVSYFIEKNDFIAFKKICRKGMNYVILIAVPLSIYFFIFAEQAIDVVSGNAFAAAIYPMKILMPTILLIGITNITGIQMLVPLGREKWVLYSEITGAVIDVILNYLLIPQFGATGAAVGTLNAEIAVLIVQVYACKDYAIKILTNIKWGKILFSVIGAAVVSTSISGNYTENLIKLIIAFFSFFIVYGILLLILKEPYVCEIIKNVLRKEN